MKRTFDHIKHVAIYLRISQEKRGKMLKPLKTTAKFFVISVKKTDIRMKSMEK